MRLIYLLLVLFVLTANNLMAETITLVGDEWCPYNCEPSSKPGFMVEIAQVVFRKQGHSVKYIMKPWSRAKVDVQSGVNDAIVGMTKNETTKKMYIFPEEEMARSQFCFYTSKKSLWEFTGIQSLTSVTLGVINKYGYGADGAPIDTYIKGNLQTGRVVAVSGDNPLERLIQMISLDRIGTTIEDHMVMGYTLSNIEQMESLKQVGCLDEIDRVHIAFTLKNPKSKLYAKILSDGFDMLKKSGELVQIIESYTKHK